VIRVDLLRAYKACHQITRQVGSSFYYGMLLLPQEKRYALYAVYAFSRICDDAVDEYSGKAAQDRLQTAEDLLDRAVSPKFHRDPNLVVQALGDTIRRYHIPKEPFLDLLRGMRIDTQPVRFQTFAELKRYCEYVAGSVGQVCIHIFGFRHRDACAFANDMGIALQLTNVMRDLKEDVERDRVYLPMEEMVEVGYSLADLRQFRHTPAFVRLMAKQVARAREYYWRATRLFSLVDADSRRCLQMLYAVYFELLKEIEANHYDVFNHRVRLSKARKFQLMWDAIWQKQIV
jgi:phytoene synthase